MHHLLCAGLRRRRHMIGRGEYLDPKGASPVWFAREQFAQEISTDHDADDAAISDDRDPLDEQ